MNVTPAQIDEIFKVFQKHEKQWTRQDAATWAEEWIEPSSLAECLDDIKYHKDKEHDKYYRICMDVLRIFYADILDSPLFRVLTEDAEQSEDSPLFKAMEEVTD